MNGWVETWRRHSLDRWVLPAALALIVGAFLAITPPPTTESVLLAIDDETTVTYGVSISPEMLLVAVVGSLTATVGVLLSRRYLAASIGLVAWPFLSMPFTGFFIWGWWLALLAVAVVAAADSWRRAAVPTLLALLVAAVYCFTRLSAYLPVGPVYAVSPAPYPGAGTDKGLSFALYTVGTLLTVTVAGAIGATSRRVRRSDAATKHAAEVEAVVTERARVARDLHDVVAHHISLIAVRAESARFTIPDLGGDATAVLADIATDARGALGELRQILAVLQRSEGGGSRDVGNGPRLAPQPGAGDIAGLVDAARTAGQEAVLVGSVGDVPAAQGYVLYRAVQESLTNARRHAAGHPVTVELSADTQAARVLVRNPLGETRPAAPGRGLVGMRERVESLGGSLVSGPDGAGSFAVQLVLPIGAAAQETAPCLASTVRSAISGTVPSASRANGAGA